MRNKASWIIVGTAEWGQEENHKYRTEIILGLEDNQKEKKLEV